MVHILDLFKDETNVCTVHTSDVEKANQNT